MLKIKNISFAYTQKEVIKNISFSLEKGSYLAILGESGCGKSTLLEIIYGLLHIEKGSIYYNDEKLLGPKFKLIPGEDFMKYLPQDFDLMPYTTVEENIGKHISSLDPNKNNRIKELLEVVDMVSYKNTKVKNLSGGQKQRVAIAKVIAKEPEILLLDEPFSHIDNFRKNKLRRSLFSYLKSKNITCIVATHDSTDALSFANEIIILKNGKIIEKGTPFKVYNNPKNAYVGSFFDEVNAIPQFKLNSETTSKKHQLLYPNSLKIANNTPIKVKVLKAYFKGSYYLIEADLKGTPVFFEHNFPLESGLEVCLKKVN
jgi:ABC-type Fe3+/spermidine/putrescine transport system ATPase subunit